MKNKKGFTLIELLAVVVVLGLIMIIATSAVGKVIENSKIKARYIAAKEITEIAMAYMETESVGVDEVGSEKCIDVKTLVDNGYLEGDVTNPGDEKAKNIAGSGEFDNQKVCTNSNSKSQSDQKPKQKGVEGALVNGYEFDGYVYSFD